MQVHFRMASRFCTVSPYLESQVLTFGDLELNGLFIGNWVHWLSRRIAWPSGTQVGVQQLINGIHFKSSIIMTSLTNSKTLFQMTSKTCFFARVSSCLWICGAHTFRPWISHCCIRGGWQKRRNNSCFSMIDFQILNICLSSMAQCSTCFQFVAIYPWFQKDS